MDNETPTLDPVATDAMIVCENSRGAEIHGTLLRLSRHEVSFEIYSASEVVQMSEVMSNFKILAQEKPIYAGRAVVTGLINTGSVLICKANLDDAWLDVDILALSSQPGNLKNAFGSLIQGWQKVYKISPDYKVVVADIQSFLFELSRWVGDVELGLSSANNGQRTAAERAAVEELVGPVTPCLNHLFEKFEIASSRIEPELQAAHGLYAKRQLHSLLLCAPFMHRIFRKPLGYAGDYEMVNMILRDPCEGSSLFAKVLNAWFLGQPPAEAHRNRVTFLTQRLKDETARTRGQTGPLRIYNLGCGPAQEVCKFIEQSPLSDHARFSLLDFNDETLAFTQRSLENARRTHQRTTDVNLIKKSVAQVIKGGMRNVHAEYDVVYCAGLFDYLSDRICQQLLNMFYEMLVPGGLLIATNVDSSNPIRNIMGYIFEWRLIERNSPGFLALSPEKASRDDCKVTADTTGGNIFLEVRKLDPTS